MNKDIYFTKEYALLNEMIEEGEAEFFELKTKNGHISDSYIKRKIDTTIDGRTYYDAVSAYGYGGPVVHETTDLKALIEDFKVFAEAYCEANHIVSSFIRFHPVFNNQEPLKEIYDISYIRDTVGTVLNTGRDTFQSQFSSTARNKVRKRLKDSHFSCHVSRGFQDIETFIDIYRCTMNRQGAEHFYYFKDDYFYRMRDLFKNDVMTVSVKYDDEVIAMGLYLLSGDIIHDHLNGTRREYLKYSPAYLLKYAALNWGEENGYRLIHYGGGVSNSPDDPVLKFKKRFSGETTFKYCTGKKIWNHSVYKKLIRKKGANPSSHFFPAYREGRIKAVSKL